jgi:hypothetical protein
MNPGTSDVWLLLYSASSSCAYNLLMENLIVGVDSKGFLIVGSAIWACYSSSERMRVMGASVANYS